MTDLPQKQDIVTSTFISVISVSKYIHNENRIHTNNQSTCQVGIAGALHPNNRRRLLMELNEISRRFQVKISENMYLFYKEKNS